MPTVGAGYPTVLNGAEGCRTVAARCRMVARGAEWCGREAVGAERCRTSVQGAARCCAVTNAAERWSLARHDGAQRLPMLTGALPLPNLALWDKVSSFIALGVHPNLTFMKGSLTNGQFVGRDLADF